MKSSKKLIVAVLPCPYFMEVNSTDHHTLSGFEGIFLDTVLRSLGLEYEIVIPEDHEWGNLGADGQWSGLVGMVQRGTADLAFTYLTLTELRSRGVDFSSPYTSSSVTFAIEKPSRHVFSKRAYLQPFDDAIWTCLLCAILLMSLVLRAILSEKLSFGEIFLKLLGSVLEQPMKFRDASARSKCLQGAWWIFAVVMCSSYSCALLSFLMVPVQATVIQTFAELAEAVERGEYKCYTAKGSMLLPYLLNSDEDNLRSLGIAIQNNNWTYNLQNLPIKDLVGVNSVHAQDRLLNELLYGSKANVVISRDYLAVFPIAFAVGAHFCCRNELNRIIARLTSAGLYEKLLGDASLKLHLSSLKDKASSSGRNRPLTLESVPGALILLVFGHSVSVVALIGEVVNSKRKQRERRPNEVLENRMAQQNACAVEENGGSAPEADELVLAQVATDF